MKTRTVIPLVIIGLLSVGNAYAMTFTQAKQLLVGFAKGNNMDFAKLKSAAKSGDAAAQMWLGVYFGLVKKDYAKANYWYKKAADQGYARGENNLGNAYKRGQGVPQDYKKANYWYKKAADQGFSIAEYNLGNAYYRGDGVPQDYKKANYWYKKAADQGEILAEYNLGFIYYRGHGVPQDNMTAIMWWKKAAAQGGKYGKMAQHNINAVDSKIHSGSDHYLSLIDLVNSSPYANNEKKYHIYFSKVVQLISEHDDLLDYKGNYYIAKFKGYAPQKGNFITGYCSGLGAIRYQSVDNRLEIVPHVFFYRFKAYSLDNLKYAAMAENLEMQQMMAIGMQAFGGKTD